MDTAAHGRELHPEESRLNQTAKQRTAARRGRVSLIILAHNGAECLPSILSQAAPEDEVVLVDLGSVDGTIEAALKMCPQTRIFVHAGRSKESALARGLVEAHGEIIVMLEADGSALGEKIPAFVDVLDRGAQFGD